MCTISRVRLPLGQVARFGCLVLCTAWLFVGCRPPDESPEDIRSTDNSRLRVVCTTGQVGDLVAQVGGDRVQVETLMGDGVDPHLYRATPGDLRRLNRAQAIFYNGLHLEGRLADVLERLSEKQPVFAVTHGVEVNSPTRLRSAPEFAGTYDPHVWFDVELWSQCASYVAACLAEIDPEHEAEYERNAGSYRQELLTLDEEVRSEISSIPPARRVLVTAHDAFGYFGQAYDIEVHGLQGISTVDEADLQSINALVDLLVTRGVKAIFVESSVPPKNIESLRQGCSARGHKIEVGGELYSDAMGSAATPEGTYVGMVRYNVRTIVEALR